MAYKLYINNKLFSGINGNNYNKGSITINGTTYQFDNSSGSSLQPITYSWRMGSTTAAPSGRIYFGKSTFKNVTTYSSNNTINNETFLYGGVTESGSRTCKISLQSNEWSDYNVVLHIYVYTASKNRSITIGGVNLGNTTMNGIQHFFGEISSLNNTAVIGGDGVDWCGIDVILTPKS